MKPQDSIETHTPYINRRFVYVTTNLFTNIVLDVLEIKLIHLYITLYLFALFAKFC